ncbi:MAG: 16S rRNA (guanine(966)-N(2))-methyltransferase RsmD [Eubacterium sp.]|nr:16S rRNA (guanine(966)-N(2))-methyltransferase RsmD [Eubacterium sp.]
MRVIAGSARRIVLDTPSGMDTRPTTDRIKETLFNIIQDSVRGSGFLDLFAGSGGIGIEALSRGAENAVFAENRSEACRCIEGNLKRTGLFGRARLIRSDVFKAIAELGAGGRKFDIIFADPPYGRISYGKLLSAIRDAGILEDDGIIIIETALGYEAALGCVDPDMEPDVKHGSKDEDVSVRDEDVNKCDSSRTDSAADEEGGNGFRITRIKEYKTNQHIFLEKISEDDDERIKN